MSSATPAPGTQQQGVCVIFGTLILVFLLASLDQTIVSTRAADDRRRAWREALVAVRRATLEELVRDWSPDDHRQLAPVLDRLARSLASEMPTPA